jgi:hypothetical protein
MRATARGMRVEFKVSASPCAAPCITGLTPLDRKPPFLASRRACAFPCLCRECRLCSMLEVRVKLTLEDDSDC